jgi:energy-coupling factor transport system substrate-specific component
VRTRAPLLIKEENMLKGLGPVRTAIAVAGVVVGLLMYLLEVPGTVGWFGNESDLSLPAGLVVALVVVIAAVLVRPGERPQGWRVVDIVVASVLGVVGGLVFSVWNLGWEPLSKTFVPPSSAMFVGIWLFPGVLGALIVRKPGAAVYTELLAATVSALVGNQWGFATVWYGLVEGLGAEVLFAVLLYRRFGVVVATVAGALAGLTTGLMDSLVYYPTLAAWQQGVYIVLAMASGAVIAGWGSWLLARALARTGALAPMASGRTVERV